MWKNDWIWKLDNCFGTNYFAWHMGLMERCHSEFTLFAIIDCVPFCRRPFYFVCMHIVKRQIIFFLSMYHMKPCALNHCQASSNISYKVASLVEVFYLSMYQLFPLAIILFVCLCRTYVDSKGHYLWLLKCWTVEMMRILKRSQKKLNWWKDFHIPT